MTAVPFLSARRLGIDTYLQPVAYVRAEDPVVRAEGFSALSRVRLVCGEREAVAVLNVVFDGQVEPGEVGLSEAAWQRLDPAPGAPIEVRHAPQLESYSHVRAKIYGNRLDRPAFDAIVRDVAAGWYTDVHLAGFVAGCAARGLDRQEMVDLTSAMVATGERLTWGDGIIADKHCIGGLPGNRTTPIVVAVCAAAGLRIPKTSSRAITSPAGTADTMETLAPVDLDLAAIRRVVAREGGCVVWGGAVRLSPVDDALIRVERPLDLDAEGQLVASILAKKVAAGATRVVIDIPVGPTAKIRTPEAARRLAEHLIAVGAALGQDVRCRVTDGSAPVGEGIGPALEAWDILAVLGRAPGAPQDLRERSLTIAGDVLELCAAAPLGAGFAAASALVDSGAALRKLEAICEAQGEMRVPGRAPHTRPVLARTSGVVAAIDNRRIARVARMAGAPRAASAGLVLHVRVGARVAAGEPLYTVHAEARGELDYALAYADSHADVFRVAPE